MGIERKRALARAAPWVGPWFIPAHAQDTEASGRLRLTTRSRFTDQRKQFTKHLRVHVHDLPVILVKFLSFCPLAEHAESALS